MSNCSAFKFDSGSGETGTCTFNTRKSTSPMHLENIGADLNGFPDVRLKPGLVYYYANSGAIPQVLSLGNGQCIDAKYDPTTSTSPDQAQVGVSGCQSDEYPTASFIISPTIFLNGPELNAFQFYVLSNSTVQRCLNVKGFSSSFFMLH
jgi:hypothetical protein